MLLHFIVFSFVQGKELLPDFNTRTKKKESMTGHYCWMIDTVLKYIQQKEVCYLFTSLSSSRILFMRLLVNLQKGIKYITNSKNMFFRSTNPNLVSKNVLFTHTDVPELSKMSLKFKQYGIS
jgi:hypothetical protein